MKNAWWLFGEVAGAFCIVVGIIVFGVCILAPTFLLLSLWKGYRLLKRGYLFLKKRYRLLKKKLREKDNDRFGAF